MENKPNMDTFCVAPWVAIHLSTFGAVLPCCMYKQERIFGELKKGIPLNETYNSESAKDIRKKLWNGEKINECQICWHREEVSNHKTNSYRNNLNIQFKDEVKNIIKNTNEDFSLKEVTFKHLDLRFDNKCNLKCRICNPSFSSSLYKEYKDLKFTEFRDFGQAYNVSVDDSEYQFILGQLKNVNSLFFAGGEPLIQDKFYEILQFCIDNDYAKNITLWVTTNFTNLQYKNYNVINMWKKFKSVEITASIDGFEQRGEYLRNGSKWKDIIKHRETLLIEIPNIVFIIVPTINIMNSYTIVDLYVDWIKKGYIEPGRLCVNLLTHPEHMQIKNLPENHKEKLRIIYGDVINWINKKVDGSKKDIEQFEFILSLLNQERNELLFQKFLQMTEKVDTYRGDNFFSIFTEFTDFKELHNK